MTTKKQQEAAIPRGPIEELGALKQRRLTAKLEAEAIAHVLGAVGVTLIVTMPEGYSEKSVAFSTYAYNVWGRALDSWGLAEVEELMEAHLREVERAAPQQVAQARARIERGRQAREELMEHEMDLVEQAVREEDFAVEEHHL